MLTTCGGGTGPLSCQCHPACLLYAQRHLTDLSDKCQLFRFCRWLEVQWGLMQLVAVTYERFLLGFEAEAGLVIIVH